MQAYLSNLVLVNGSPPESGEPNPPPLGALITLRSIAEGQELFALLSGTVQILIRLARPEAHPMRGEIDWDAS
jgi:hypothetical protein